MRRFATVRPTFFCLLTALCLGPAWPVPLRADNDWLGIEAPRPFDSGVINVSERLSSAEFVDWQNGGFWQANAFNYMVNFDGNVVAENLLTLDTRLEWRASRRLYVEVDLPTVFNELSPYYSDALQYYNVGTPGVEESQGLGDVSVGLRGDFRGDVVRQGADAGWALALVAPTGLGPFAAAQTLAGTGAGRWQLVPGLVFGGRTGPWEGWFQARGRVQFGQEAQVSSRSYVDWSSSDQNGQYVGGNTVLPGSGGGLWLGPRYGTDCVAGLSWIWYQDADTRMGLACEAAAHWLSPWTTAAGPTGLPAEEYFVVTPEIQARYGAYSAVVGWQTEYLWAVEEPGTNYGEIIFDVAYTL